MRVLLIKFSGLTLLALLAASCSIQKRTTLPGFHVERMHKASAQVELGPSQSAKVKEMPPLHVKRLASEFTRPVLTVEQHLNTPLSAQVTTLHAIQPRAFDVDLAEPELLEPQPWEKEAKTQSLFGVVSLVSFCLGAILMAMGTPHPLPFLLAMVALLMKKIQANKVLDLMEAHGEDGKTRREHRQEQRRESKSLWRTALKTVLLAIAALALILAIDNALVFSVTL